MLNQWLVSKWSAWPCANPYWDHKRPHCRTIRFYLQLVFASPPNSRHFDYYFENWNCQFHCPLHWALFRRLIFYPTHVHTLFDTVWTRWQSSDPKKSQIIIFIICSKIQINDAKLPSSCDLVSPLMDVEAGRMEFWWILELLDRWQHRWPNWERLRATTHFPNLQRHLGPANGNRCVRRPHWNLFIFYFNKNCDFWILVAYLNKIGVCLGTLKYSFPRISFSKSAAIGGVQYSNNACNNKLP